MPKNDLVELSYKSDAVNDFGFLGIMRLLETSYHWNLRHDLTGVLFYDRGHFGQILEGKRADIEEIWSRIEKDSRHHHVELIGIREIDERRFPSWALKLYDGKAFAKILPQFANALSDIAMSNLEMIKTMHALGFEVNNESVVGKSPGK